MARVSPNLTVAFLARRDDENSRAAIDAVCAIEGVQPALILVDSGRRGFARRSRELWRGVAREGLGWLLRALIGKTRKITDRWLETAAVRRWEVEDLLRRSFPARILSLADIGSRRGVPVRECDWKCEEMAAALRECSADLAIVLGPELPCPKTLSVPRLGSLHAHLGELPGYSGVAPGFWELFEHAHSASVTIHFAGAGCCGDTVASAVVPVRPGETPDTLARKLGLAAPGALAEAVRAVLEGALDRHPAQQPASGMRGEPTHEERAHLRRSLPHWPARNDAFVLAKNLYCLGVYYSGVYAAVRWARRAFSRRAVILLHHRVNDHCMDSLTVDTVTFAGQLTALRRRYRPISTAELVACLRQRERIPRASVAIHFDDCYRDVLTNGAPLLKAGGFPAMAFVNSGFVGADRQFAHDRDASPFRHENLSPAEVRRWVEDGFELGAHTVNHVDLGVCGLDEARNEIANCRRELEEISGQPVKFFSYPYGKENHIRAETVALIREAGHTALFSAYGGFVSDSTDVFDIPRMGCSHVFKPLLLLLAMEGLLPVRRGVLANQYAIASVESAAGAS